MEVKLLGIRLWDIPCIHHYDPINIQLIWSWRWVECFIIIFILFLKGVLSKHQNHPPPSNIDKGCIWTMFNVVLCSDCTVPDSAAYAMYKYSLHHPFGPVMAQSWLVPQYVNYIWTMWNKETRHFKSFFELCMSKWKVEGPRTNIMSDQSYDKTVQIYIHKPWIDRAEPFNVSLVYHISINATNPDLENWRLKMLTINYTIKRGAPRQYFNIWQYSTLNWSKPWSLTVQLYGVEHRREDTIMDTNLLMMQMDVLLTDNFLTIIHHLLQYYSCSNVGNSLMNVFWKNSWAV